MTYAGAFNKFPGNSALFKFKQKITGWKAVQIMVQLNSLSNFKRTPEINYLWN